METESMKKEEIDKLIISVLTNDATSDEILALDHWVRKNDDNRQYFLRFRNSWFSISQLISPDRTRTMKALENVSQQIAKTQSDKKTDSGTKLLPSSANTGFRYFRTAALWLLIFGMGAVFTLLVRRTTGLFNLTTSASVEAPRGSKAMTTLPDGTIVWLNAGSFLEYKIPAGKPARSVSLTGEAYFNVAHDPDHPFIVNAGDMIIKAYGTEFNVKAYPEEKEVETTLVEGSVSVEIRNKPSNRTLLKPNEQAVYFSPSEGRTENFLVTKGVDPSYFTLWIKDRLHIKGEKLEDLAIILERKYNVTIHFNEPALKELRFTGVIENETIEQILEMIKISSNVGYSIDGREVWLSKKH